MALNFDLTTTLSSAYRAATLSGFAKEAIVSVSLTIALVMIWRLTSMSIKSSDSSVETKRSRLSKARSVFAITLLVSLFAVWGGEIRSALLSVAAIAAAVIVVSKETVSCLWGYLVFVTTKPASIGDSVEASGVDGELVDVSWFCMTVMERLPSGYKSGRMVKIPNSVLLTSNFFNNSFGGFVMTSLSVPSSISSAVEDRDLLSMIASGVCSEWASTAAESLRAASGTHLVETPSAEPVLSISLGAEGECSVSARFPCPADRRVSATQAVIAAYCVEKTKAAASSPQLADSDAKAVTGV